MLKIFRWFALALAGILLVAAILVSPLNDDLKAITAIVGLFLLVPLAIVTYRDAVRNLTKLSPSRRTQALILGLPIRILGAVSLVSGLAILAWVGYNLVDPDPVFTGIKSLGQLVLPVILVFVGWRWLAQPLAKSADDAEEASPR